MSFVLIEKIGNHITLQHLSLKLVVFPPFIHPAIFSAYLRSGLGDQAVPCLLTINAFQILLVNPKTLPGQPAFISESWAYTWALTKDVRGTPLFDMKKRQLHWELPLDFSALNPISKAESSRSSEKPHFGYFHLWPCRFGHYPELMTIGEGRIFGRPERKELCPATLSLPQLSSPFQLSVHNIPQRAQKAYSVLMVEDLIFH